MFTTQYTYYTLSAFNIRVPIFIKRTLTSLQISQFIIGASYAMIHSFISYDVPVTTTILTSSAPAGAGSATPEAIGSDASHSAFFDSLKQLVLGVASKVTTSAITHKASSGANAEAQHPTTTEETIYTNKLIPCITTTGQTFAIWLNVLYLAPLTYLFVKFFITSYLKRSGAESSRKGKTSHESHVAVAEKAGWDAAQGLQQEVYGTPENVNGRVKVAPADGNVTGSSEGRVLRPVTNQRHSRHA